MLVDVDVYLMRWKLSSRARVCVCDSCCPPHQGTLKMREAAALLASCLTLCLLLGVTVVAKPGQDMRCGGCARLDPFSYPNPTVFKKIIIEKKKKSERRLTACRLVTATQRAGLWWTRWSGPSPKLTRRKPSRRDRSGSTRTAASPSER